MTAQEVARLQDELEDAHACIERLEARLGSLVGVTRQELARRTAEAQREACASIVEQVVDVGDGARAILAAVVRDTPLVTEGTP